MLSPLTRRQKEILDYINSMISLNGYAPSLQEIKDSFKLKAISTVHEHLENLKNKGYIKKEMNQARGIQVQKIEELEKYLTIKQKGNILDGKFIARANPKNDFVIDKFLLGRAKSVFSLLVVDNSLKDNFILANDIVIFEECEVAEKGELAVLKFGKAMIIDKAKATNEEQLVAKAILVIRRAK